MSKKKRIKHSYVTELELKSLLIRVKNRDLKKEKSQKYNSIINKYTKIHTKLNNLRYEKTSYKIQKKKIIIKHLKTRIIELSEQTEIDKISHERFGKVILLMIKHILTKPNFSGYTYVTEFYSDAIHKILKYLHNFDHKLISERSGFEVNAFAYISQIIHNSIIFIINQKKKELTEIDKQVSLEISENQLLVQDHRKFNHSTFNDHELENVKKYKISIEDAQNNFIKAIKSKIEKHGEIKKNERIEIFYPKCHSFSLKEYDELRPFLKHISIISYK